MSGANSSHHATTGAHPATNRNPSIFTSAKNTAVSAHSKLQEKTSVQNPLVIGAIIIFIILIIILYIQAFTGKVGNTNTQTLNVAKNAVIKGTLTANSLISVSDTPSLLIDTVYFSNKQNDISSISGGGGNSFYYANVVNSNAPNGYGAHIFSCGGLDGPQGNWSAYINSSGLTICNNNYIRFDNASTVLAINYLTFDASGGAHINFSQSANQYGHIDYGEGNMIYTITQQNHYGAHIFACGDVGINGSSSNWVGYFQAGQRDDGSGTSWGRLYMDNKSDIQMTGGSLYFYNGGSVVESSDYRLKENIEPIDDHYVVDQLKPCSYNFISDEKKSKRTGFIAHELQEVFPHLVTGEKDGKDSQGVEYMGLIAILTKEIQTLKLNFNSLKSDNTELKNTVIELKSDNIELKNKISELEKTRCLCAN